MRLFSASFLSGLDFWIFPSFSYLNGRGEKPGRDAPTPQDFDNLVKAAFKTDQVEVARKLATFDAKAWAADCLAFGDYGNTRYTE
jgi:hypothetical protein